jgi:hypothetical protein
LPTDWIAALALYGPTVIAIILSVLTFAVLFLQVRILRQQTGIQENQLRLSESISFSVEAIISNRSGKMRLQFENQGKGTARARTAVQYVLKRRNPSELIQGNGTLQSIGPSKQADLQVAQINGINTPDSYDKFENIVVSWQGVGADDRPFRGSNTILVTEFRHED